MRNVIVKTGIKTTKTDVSKYILTFKMHRSFPTEAKMGSTVAINYRLRSLLKTACPLIGLHELWYMPKSWLVKQGEIVPDPQEMGEFERRNCSDGIF